MPATPPVPDAPTPAPASPAASSRPSTSLGAYLGAALGWLLAALLLGLGVFNLLRGDWARGAGMLLILPLVAWLRLPSVARRMQQGGPLDRSTTALLITATGGALLYLSQVILHWAR